MGKARDWGQAKPAAFASLIILRHRILANGFTATQVFFKPAGSARANLAEIFTASNGPYFVILNTTKSGHINYQLSRN
jgi:hypothetical protein